MSNSYFFNDDYNNQIYNNNYDIGNYNNESEINENIDVYEEETEAEDVNIFVSLWREQRQPKATIDSRLASSCVWPEINRIVHLKRLDVFQSDNLTTQQFTTDINESRRIRRLNKWNYEFTLFLLDEATPYTKELTISTTTLPRRDKIILTDRINRRDLATWVIKEKIHGYFGTERIPGSLEFNIDFIDSPDRYMINPKPEPVLGYRRLYKFAAYPVSQYFILEKEVQHECLDSEGGSGMTYMIFKGPSIFSRKNWRLIGSFYGFDLPLQGTNCYTIYYRTDPFPRMMIAIDKIERVNEWKVLSKFYSFDIPLPGTTSYQLQHCLRSIHSTAANVPRHRLTTDDVYMPWEFRMTIYVFPANIDDCTITNVPSEHDHF